MVDARARHMRFADPPRSVAQWSSFAKRLSVNSKSMKVGQKFSLHTSSSYLSFDHSMGSINIDSRLIPRIIENDLFVSFIESAECSG